MIQKRPATHEEIQKILECGDMRHTKVAKLLGLHPSVVLMIQKRSRPISRKPKRQSKKSSERIKQYSIARKQCLSEVKECEVCGNKDALSIHHIAGRAGSLLTDRENFLVVCMSGSFYLSEKYPESSKTEGCHPWIERNLKLARELGYAKSKIRNNGK